MFESALLNWLCTYSSLRWTELPVELRVFEELPSLDYIAGTESNSRDMEEEDEVRQHKIRFFFSNKNLTPHFF